MRICIFISGLKGLNFRVCMLLKSAVISVIVMKCNSCVKVKCNAKKDLIVLLVVLKPVLAK